MKKALSILISFILVTTLLCGCDADTTEAPVENSAAVEKQMSEEAQAPQVIATPEPEAAKEEIAEKIPEPEPVIEAVNTVSLTVDCSDVLNNMDSLKEEKHSIIPQNGIIYANSRVEIIEGDSVFAVLKRALASSGVHLEFSLTPVYNSAYIEGIGNLYEFDCGERSGWKFSVNGEFPRAGCSDVKVKPSDKIVFVYKVVGY